MVRVWEIASQILNVNDRQVRNRGLGVVEKMGRLDSMDECEGGRRKSGA